MNKRIICILLTLAMVLTLVPSVAFAENAAGFDNFKKVQTYTDGQFTDIMATDWFAENVAAAYELNLMLGRSDDFFDTESNLTVAEAMTIAARLREIYYTGKAEFTQDKGYLWYQVYTDYCKANGIADPADYDLGKAITRGEFAEIFAKALPSDALKKINEVQDNMIPDVKKTDKFSEAIYLLYRAGIIVGNDEKGTFAPDSNIRRMEVVAITTRMAQPTLRQSITLVEQNSDGIDAEATIIGGLLAASTLAALALKAAVPIKYTVTFNMKGHGTQIAPLKDVVSGSTISAPTPDPTTEGYTFGGWYKEAACTNAWDFATDTVTADTTLYAKWTQNPPVPVLTPVDAPTAATGLNYNGTEQTGVAESTGYTVTKGKATNAGSYTATATLAEGYKWSDDTTVAKQIEWSIAKASLKATADNKEVTVGDVAPEYTVTYTGWVNGESINIVEPTTAAVLACEYTPASVADDYDIIFTTAPKFANYDVTTVEGKLTAKSACLAAGTMITMEDGSRQAVETLELGDMIKTFDHETGEVSSAPVCYIWESKNVGNAFTLTFEDDIEVTVIEEHGFYDQEEQKYVFINLQNAKEYMGHHFYNADTNSWLELLGCEKLDGTVDAYAIITSGHLNHMSNGMLSMCDGTVKKVANIFEYDDQMKFDENKKKADIEAYGLTSKEKIMEFEGFLESDYDDYNLKYLNVAIGKGLTTWEWIKAFSDYCVANGL